MVNGNIGLYVCGGWVASTLTTLDKYPRDWQAGILPMPYPEGSEPSSLFIDTCYAVPSTSSNKDAAFAAIRCIAENKYTLGYGRIPAKTLTEEEARSYIEATLVPMFAHDGITVDEFMAGWFDSSRNYIDEKIVGPADTVINQIVSEESLLYGQGAKSLDDTIASIKTRADEAIAEAQAE
jgi:multiple sugar transport system substrate-binding protein